MQLDIPFHGAGPTLMLYIQANVETCCKSRGPEHGWKSKRGVGLFASVIALDVQESCHPSEAFRIIAS